MSDSPHEPQKKTVNKDSFFNLIVVALSVCLVCSIVVSTAAVKLKPLQIINKELDEKQNILRAAGMLPEGGVVDEQGRTVDELFSQFEVKAVNLETGEFIDGVDPSTIDPIRASKDPSLSRDLSSAEDIAVLGRRENTSIVYVRRNDSGIDKIVLPVRGYGLWGTLLGYLALEGDLNTVGGLGYYSHKETPGLGGEVDNPKWKAQWSGVQIYDAQGEPAVKLVKRRSPEKSAAAAHEVDALSGATMTSRGVENMIKFWTSDLGFGPFLNRLGGRT